MIGSNISVAVCARDSNVSNFSTPDSSLFAFKFKFTFVSSSKFNVQLQIRLRFRGIPKIMLQKIKIGWILLPWEAYNSFKLYIGGSSFSTSVVFVIYCTKSRLVGWIFEELMTNDCHP